MRSPIAKRYWRISTQLRMISIEKSDLTQTLTKRRTMSRNYLVQSHLEYLVEQSLKKGLTEKQAIDYANNIFFSKGE